MQRCTFISVLVLAIALSGNTVAGELESRGQSTQQKTAKPVSEPSRVYYGGIVGLSLFGDIFRISAQPMVGYKVTPQFSIGAKVGYEYLRDKRFDPSLTYHNYGASAFARYRFVPQAYGHVEFAGINYDYRSGREWVPFLLVGGGYVQPVSQNVAFVVEVLFDVLQSSKSPYKDWDPWISVGVGVGF